MTKLKIEDKDNAERRLYKIDRVAMWNNPPVRLALEAHDRLFDEIDGQFGVDVLQTLVSPDMAAKFGRVLNKRDAAMQAGTEDEIIATLGSVCRGLEAMKAEAIGKGYTTGLNGKRWRTTAPDGTRWLFTQTIEDAKGAAALPDFKGFQIWSIPEVIRMLQASSLVAVLTAKDHFPGVEVKTTDKPRSALSDLINDEIPF